ncbi:hypothetical protein BYT27DRAFT_7013141, partial [Phlegmacium glaucopus]
LLTYLWPSLADKDIPHRTKLRAVILSRAKKVEEQLCEVSKLIPGKVFFTFNSWTSESGNPYLSVT